MTRQRILEVARDVFASIGYNRTSLRTIADRVGMTVPGVLHHFGSKEQMLIAVLEERDRVEGEFVASLMADTSLTPADGLRRLSQLQTDDEGMLRLSTVIAAEALDPEHPAHAYFLARNAELLRSGARLFDAAKERAVIGSDAERDSSVLVITALFEGLALQWLRDPTVDIEGTIAAFVESCRWLTPDARADQPD